MVRVLEEVSKLDTQNAVVVVEGDNPAELTNRETRDAVLRWARSHGFPARGLSGLPQTYPVDDKGETNPEVVLGKVPCKAHRADFQLSAGLGMV